MTAKSLLLIWATFFCCTALAGADVKVTLKVVDDAGQPVEGASGGLTVYKRKSVGEGWGANLESVRELTDAQGLVTLSGDTESNEVGIGARKEGYYRTRIPYYTFEKMTGNFWTPWNPRRLEPWNPTIAIELKKILNPIPLYARKIELDGDRVLPTDGRKRGFDLERGDWVTPHGKGTSSDLVFQLVAKQENEDKYEATLTLSFSKAGDGIVSVIADPRQGSQLRLPRHAPDSGYEAQMTENLYRDMEKPEGQQVETGIRDDQNYFFRVRTIKDSAGVIQRAIYGKIHGDIEFWDNGVMRFTYYLNPNFNDRNMEFDPKRNLFKDLTSLENVQDP